MSIIENKQSNVQTLFYVQLKSKSIVPKNLLYHLFINSIHFNLVCKTKLRAGQQIRLKCGKSFRLNILTSKYSQVLKNNMTKT